MSPVRIRTAFEHKKWRCRSWWAWRRPRPHHPVALAAVMTARLLRMPAGLRKNEGTTWCGAQTRAHSFPHLRILPAPLAPLLAISLALLCVSGLICRCRHGAKRRQSLLEDSGHLFCALSGGRLGCGGTFSFLNLVAGGQLDVGLHVGVHVGRLGRC